jgi:hypothetical protein
MSSRWAGTLVTEEPNPKLDLDDYVGQRSATFRFDIVDSATGYRNTVNPIRNAVPVLTHDTSRTIKRQITGLLLGVADTALFNTVTSRLEVLMTLGGVDYPLGRYIPNSQIRFPSTGGTQSSTTFYDEGFIVDQELTTGFGSMNNSEAIFATVTRLLSGLPIKFTVEPSPFTGSVSWTTGARRGYVCEQLSIDGDWFSPWFDNNSIMRWIRTFDPTTAIPTFDLDSGNRVLRGRVVETDDLISAPNRFVVISNGISAVGANSSPVVGIYDIPDSAPHSALNRGFIIQRTMDRQLTESDQASAVARNLGQQNTIFETVELTTAPDPRHDSYDVIRWRGSNWLEISWSLPLAEGSQMQHVARKAYGG